MRTQARVRKNRLQLDMLRWLPHYAIGSLGQLIKSIANQALEI
jgi:hypothetical protein